MNEKVMSRMREIGNELSELLIEQNDINGKVGMLKEELIRYAEENGINAKTEVGGIMLIPTMRNKATLKTHLVTPDWLYRFRQEGGRFDFKPKVDGDDFGRYDELLKEVGYEVEFTPGWIIKRK